MACLQDIFSIALLLIGVLTESQVYFGCWGVNPPPCLLFFFFFGGKTLCLCFDSVVLLVGTVGSCLSLKFD